MGLKFPKNYLDSLQVVSQVYKAVEKTHSGCGKLALMEMVCDASNRSLLVVASSGTGKSAVMRWHNEIIDRDKMMLDSVTIPGLKYLQKRLSGHTLSLLIDDLSKGGTEYSQVMTVCALGELVYSGFIRKFTSNLQLSISGFHGSAIMNAQPLILRRILKATEFETDIRDKVIRFYHIRRPVKIELESPSNSVKYGYGFGQVDIPDVILKNRLWRKGLSLFRFEFTKARSREHYTALVRASAFVNGRAAVEEADLWLVNQICGCFVLESELFSKMDLEGERRLDVNILPLLSVLATHKSYSVANLMMDFQVKQSRIYQILENNGEWVGIVKHKDHKVIVPTKACIGLLESMGEW